MPLALRLRGPLRPEVLETALADVLARHESLRTTFPVADGEPRQHVLADAGPSLPVVHVTEDDLAAAVEAAAGHAFDLATELPLRAELLAIAPGRARARAGAAPHRERRLVPRPAAPRPRHRLRRPGSPARAPDGRRCPCSTPTTRSGSGSCSATPTTRRASAPGSSPTGGTPSPVRPTSSSCPPTGPARPRRATGAASSRSRSTAALHRALLDLARGSGTTLFMVLQAALATLLTRLGAGTDIPLGTPVAGRPDEALDDLVGFFVNTLVLRTDTSGDPTFSELLARVREADLAAYSHQDVPFDRLVEELNPERSLSQHPLFQVMLALQTGADAAFDVPGLTRRARADRIGRRQVRPDAGRRRAAGRGAASPGTWSSPPTCSTGRPPSRWSPGSSGCWPPSRPTRARGSARSSSCRPTSGATRS